MKEYLKLFYFKSIVIFQTIVSILSVVLFNRYGIGRRFKKLKTERKRESVSILANGPSVGEIVTNRKTLLEHTDLLVVNFFGNTNDFFKCKPQFYVLLDPAFFDPNYTSKGLKEESREKKLNEKGKLLLENFSKVDWNMTLFVPHIKGLFNINNPYISIVEFNATRVVGFEKFQNWMYRHNQGLPNSRNVITPAMLLMINLGYKRIYLYGCEFSWTKTMDVDPENGRLFFNDRHFYSKSEIRYFGEGAFHWWLDSISEYLTGVEKIARYATSEGVKIINRTKGSFIDCFEYENPDVVA